LSLGGANVAGLRVTVGERIAGLDGTFTFDATVRYELMGVNFLVLVEAKLYTHSVKRELVQALHSKVQSVGAQKGVLITTAQFQQGAMDFAKGTRNRARSRY
jgi:restriction endonuclease Mrr